MFAYVFLHPHLLLHGKDGGWALPFLPSLQGKLMRPAAHSLMHTLQPQPHTQLAPSPTHKGNIQCDA